MGNNASTGTSTTTNGNGNGNRSRSRSRNRRRRRHRSLQHPQSQITGNDAVDADSAIRSSQYPNALSPGGVQPSITVNLGDRQLPCGPVSPMMAPFVEHQKAVTIRNSVNIKKETLRIEPDQDQPGSFLLSFIFDATTPGSITVMFFAKETIDGDLVAVNGAMLKQISMPFEQGLCQKFIQSSGTGIDFSMLEETALKIEGDSEVYPLVVKAEALPSNIHETGGNPSFQITLASFEKREKGDYKVQVLKQILWVNGNRYELQEIYGIGNAGDGDFDDVESGRACVICLSEPRDITVLPCRHMCMCSGCAKLLKSHNCPICRHPVERLLEIMVDNGSGNR